MKTFIDGLNLTRHKVLIIAVSAVFIIVATITIIMLTRSAMANNFEGRMPVYFFNAAAGELQAEPRDIPENLPASAPEEDIQHKYVLAAMHYMRTGPEAAILTNTWPSEQEGELVKNFQVSEGVLSVHFADVLDNLGPLDKALFRSAFSLTMLSLPFVQQVEFNTGDAVITETISTIANNPDISPVRISSGQFTLFFTDESGEGLITELYEADDVNINQRERGRFILERLIQGPVYEGATRSIPADTRVRSVRPDSDAGGIYVNLSREFATQFIGSTRQAELMIYSIVNTLIENNVGPRRVFFQIESERREEFHGVQNFHLGFTFNEQLMIHPADYEYELDEEYQYETEDDDS